MVTWRAQSSSDTHAFNTGLDKSLGFWGRRMQHRAPEKYVSRFENHSNGDRGERFFLFFSFFSFFSVVSFCHILYCLKPLNGLAKTMRDIQALKHYNVVAKPVGCCCFFFKTYHEIAVVNNRLVTDFQHKMLFTRKYVVHFLLTRMTRLLHIL